MKVVPLITVALILCIAFPGLIQAKKKKFCRGNDGTRYEEGEGYEDREGEACIHYKCAKKKGKLVMKTKKCVEDGEWSPWSSWTDCSATCGKATKKRTRTCSNPAPSNGGKPCNGTEKEIEKCSNPPCGPDINEKVNSLELNVQSLNDSMQTLQATMLSVLELMTTLQSAADKQECNNGGELLSITSDNNMALCKDIKNNTCEKDLFNLCPVGWHLCNPKEFNNRNDDWSYTTPAFTFGQMYCRPNGGTSPFVITNSLNQDDPGNCGHYWSSRPGCELWEGAQYDGACNNKDATALCCAPAHKCGNGAVDSVEEECDDGNDNELDDCLNSCAWRTPSQHGLNYCQ